MQLESVYLDHASTTLVRPEVRSAMAPYLDDRFGNPSSMHRWGRQARNALEQARERVASALGAHRREIVFTGGGTEADNIAVLGRWRAVCRASVAQAVACSAVEHKAVSAAAKCAAEEGALLLVIGVDEDGRVTAEAVAEAVAGGPCVLSIMWANNEVGTVQPVAAVGSLCRDAGVVFHTDAVQAFGKLRVRVDETPCDLLSLSAHKVGGPKGIGALYVREGVHVQPLVHGGGQERDLRPGTENVAAAVGFAAAVELAAAEQATESARLRLLRDRLEARLSGRLPELEVNGAGAERLPGIVHVTVPRMDQEALLVGLDLHGVAVSGGSACQTGATAPSHVLAAMGRGRPDCAVVRFSMGHGTSADEVDFAVAAFEAVVAQVRNAGDG